MEKSHFELDKSRQHDLLYLYPVLFRESIYALAYDQGLYINRLQNAVYDNKSSLLIVKRLITRMYQQNYFLFYPNDSKNIFFGGYNKNLYFQRLAGGVEVIVQIPFSLRFISLGGSKILKGGSEILKSYNLGSVQSYNLGSVHSIFPFLEDKFPYLNYMLDVQIPYPINLELLVQTLRYYLKDIYFFHLLRLFLHQYFDWDRNSLLFFQNNYKWISNYKGPSDLSKPNPRLFLFLFNFYIFEYESIFLFLRKKSSHLRLTSFRVFFERIDFYGKMEHLGKVFANDFPVTLWLFKEPLMHYVRFKTKFVLSSKSSFLFMNKWKYFFINLWQLHFCFWSNPRRIRLNQLYEYSFEFLCYYLSVQLNLSVVRSQMLENSFLISSVIKKLDTTFPMVPLIRSLNKLKYCNALGQPISKPFLTDLSDFYIIYRFARLYRDLSYYYSGSSKKKNFYQIKYIFQLSCIKTLALKHKSSARVLLKRLGSEFLQEFFTEEEEEILSLIFPRTSSTLRRLYRGRVWFLDILCIYFHFYCAK